MKLIHLNKRELSDAHLLSSGTGGGEGFSRIASNTSSSISPLVTGASLLPYAHLNVPACRSPLSTAGDVVTLGSLPSGYLS